MLRIHSIAITQFKNYPFSTFHFNERVVGICGLNGHGKTNLLDAVYYCCFTKSYFSSTEAQNVQFQQDGFRLEAQFNKNNEDQKLVCIYRGPGKRELTLNGSLYEKMSQHIGTFPAVMVAPDDVELIIGGSEERRRFIDTVISQVDAAYLSYLIQYNKILQQRNSLLKRFAEQGKSDWPLLDVLDEQLLVPGNYIHTARTAFAATLVPLVQQYYAQISGKRETVALQYESQLNDNSFEKLLLANRQKDCLLQRTNSGIHKDDVATQLNGQPFKSTASQGQRKSLLFALKLAEFDILKNNKGFAPLLFLDDVFEKLDDTRMQQLLLQVCKQNDGQVFITDTHRDRLEDAFNSLDVAYQVIEL
ncbi:MAG: DNA replication and repair protein RecF [Bacteroidetes bacterium]|nr:DNA replication and repair protein RecF [Bacteroidota bacterium]